MCNCTIIIVLRWSKRKIYFKGLKQGCAIFFNGGPNTNKHNILRPTFKKDNILPTIDIASDKNKTAIISKTVIPVLFEKNRLVKKQKDVTV